jgi:hypothetical protein
LYTPEKAQNSIFKCVEHPTVIDSAMLQFNQSLVETTSLGTSEHQPLLLVAAPSMDCT